MNENNGLNELATALSKAQATIKHAEMNRENPHFKRKYATLSSIWDVIREPLTKNGLSIVQMPMGADDGWFCLETRLLHSSGQYISSVMRLPVSKHDAQGYGSACTYARRFSLAAMAGVCPDEDDDGNEAAQQSQRQNASPSRQDARQAPAPESRGDAAAQTARPHQDVADAITNDPTKAGRRFYTILHKRFDATSGNDRLACAVLTELLLPKTPILSCEGWDVQKFGFAAQKIEKLTDDEVVDLTGRALDRLSGEDAANDDPFDSASDVIAPQSGVPAAFK